jgi:hypothetical protein
MAEPKNTLEPQRTWFERNGPIILVLGAFLLIVIVAIIAKS